LKVFDFYSRARMAQGASVGLILLAVSTLSNCTETASLQGGGLSGPTSGGASGTPGTTANTSIFPDIPIPDGAQMIVDRTLVVGTDNWFGQLALSAPHGAASMFDFYRNRLPQFSWNEITSVRAPVSVLTYERDERILQMQIKGTTLGGAEITITVSPRGTKSGVIAPAS